MHLRSAYIRPVAHGMVCVCRCVGHMAMLCINGLIEMLWGADSHGVCRSELPL